MASATSVELKLSLSHADKSERVASLGRKFCGYDSRMSESILWFLWFQSLPKIMPGPTPCDGGTDRSMVVAVAVAVVVAVVGVQ